MTGPRRLPTCMAGTWLLGFVPRLVALIHRGGRQTAPTNSQGPNLERDVSYAGPVICCAVSIHSSSVVAPLKNLRNVS